MAGCKTLQTNISLNIGERNTPLTLKLGISGVFLLEYKEWAWHLKDITLNNNLLKFNKMSDFNKTNVN
jgi:hypothetical protein